MSFFSELRRRSVFKVAAAYAVVGWLLIQIASTVLPTFDAPPWVVQTFTFLLVLAFPLVLLVSWAFEITPAGIKKTQRIPLEDSITHMSGPTLNYLITAVLGIAVVFMAVDNYLLRETGVSAAADAASTLVPPSESGAADRAAGSARILPNSIAVLPFDNLSPDPNNDYFAAGIHEEILNQLVKLRNLNVIARTSVMQYAGVARPITEIARELNVGAIMEGSVSYADGRVAVSAQLIDAETGVHVWSERYNTEFANVFDIQTDIAMNIANALQAEFSTDEQERLERRPTQSTAAYAYYLRSLALPQEEMTVAIDYLNRAIELDPAFSDAYGALAVRYAFRGRGSPGLERDWQAIATDAANKGLELNPDLVSGYTALANIHSYNWEWAEARRLLERAYELSPTDTGLLNSYATFKRDTGEYREAIRLFQRCHELDPDSGCALQLAIAQRYAGDYDASMATAEAVAASSPNLNIYLHLAYGETARGNRAAALEHLQTTEELARAASITDGLPIDRFAQLAFAYKHLGRPRDVERLIDELERRSAASPVSDATWAMADIARGNYDAALSRLARALEHPGSQSLITLGQLKANDLADPVLEQPEWRALRARINAL